MRLSNASSGRVTDGEATGTIKNTDPLPRALLARFGRTAAVQVVEQVRSAVGGVSRARVPGPGGELRRGMERDVEARPDPPPRRRRRRGTGRRTASPSGE